jgi:hypothetical protein
MLHEAVGYDRGKKIKGRKRFTLVDTLGLLISVKVVAAACRNGKGQNNCSISYTQSVRAFLD